MDVIQISSNVHEKVVGLQDQINKISENQEKQNATIEKLLSFLQEGEDEPDNVSDSDDQQKSPLSVEPIASGSNDADPVAVQGNKEGTETTSGDDTMAEEQKTNHPVKHSFPKGMYNYLHFLKACL